MGSFVPDTKKEQEVLDGDIVELLHRSLDLKLVRLPVHDETVAVVLFGLRRKLLCYDWFD